MVDFIVAKSWIDHDGIVAKAIEVRKYDPNEAVEPDPWLQLRKSRMDSRSGAPARANPLTALGSTKSLQRQTTDEALEEEKKRLDKRRELLQVKKQLHEAEHQLATVALGSSNTQAPPSSSAQAPPGLSIQSGTPVALQPQHGVFNAILPQKMLAPINIHCEQQTSILST